MARLRLIEHGLMTVAGHGFGSWPSTPVSIGLFVAVVALVALCAHQPAKEKPNSNSTTDRTNSKKLMNRTISRNKINPSATQKKRGGDDHAHEIRVDVSAQVPLPSSTPPPPPPQPAAEKRREKISPPGAPHRKNSKDLSASSRRRDGSDGGGGGGCEKKGKIGAKVATGGFGEGGLWQKSILRGEKCQLPEFSGVIFYDSRGNQIQVAE
ncbi:unnamed protein product [Linum trigynum]|uniref:Uncharacterized protein n=1 Tax=Linum trigynum TaxID=586398 RepID=A0AAV2GCU7_9ROSI